MRTHFYNLYCDHLNNLRSSLEHNSTIISPKKLQDRVNRLFMLPSQSRRQIEENVAALDKELQVLSKKVELYKDICQKQFADALVALNKISSPTPEEKKVIQETRKKLVDTCNAANSKMIDAKNSFASSYQKLREHISTVGDDREYVKKLLGFTSNFDEYLKSCFPGRQHEWKLSP